MGSTIGILLVGLLADAGVNPAIATTFQAGGHAVSLAGGAGQFFNQLRGLIVTAALAGIATWVILKVIQATVGLRVSAEDEDSGLDLTQHGESAYND